MTWKIERPLAPAVTFGGIAKRLQQPVANKPVANKARSRDPEKRRIYMRDLMRRRRAAAKAGQ